MAASLPDPADAEQGSRIAARPMPPPSPRGPTDISRLVVLITSLSSVAVLYFAREVLIPLALAILLSFVLAPSVNRLAKLGLGRVFSVLVATTLSLLVIAALTWVMAHQTLALAENMPEYRDNIQQKIRSLKPQSGGALGRATDTLKQIGEDLVQRDSRPASAPDSLAPPLASNPLIRPSVTPATEPVPVEIIQKPAGALMALTGAFAPLASPLVSAGIVIVFVNLILLHRRDLRDRVISLIGPEQLAFTTQALDEGASRVSRYLLMLLIVNGSYGVGVGVCLSLVGVPNAMFFGLAAGLLRFIPYVGPWIGAALPITLSLPPAATGHARYLCKRVLARFGGMRLVVGIWNASDVDRARDRIRTCGTDRVVATFTQAIELLRS